MSKRNILEEIRQLRERNEFDNGLMTTRLIDLIQLEEHIKDSAEYQFDEFYKYLPIASVACIESFLRSSVCLLINEKNSYFDNLPVLLDRLNQKINFEIVANIHKKKFSIGELVSHILPCSNIYDLNRSLSDILGQDFLQLIQNHRLVFNNSDTELEFSEDFKNIKTSVVRSFELRHLFCHESASIIKIDRSEMINDLKNCKRFLTYAADYIYSLVYKDWALSPMDKVEALFKEFCIKEKYCDEKLEEYKIDELKISDFPKDFENNFDLMVKIWKKFRDAKAKFKGSFTPSATWSNYANLTDKLKSIDLFLSEIVP